MLCNGSSAMLTGTLTATGTIVSAAGSDATGVFTHTLGFTPEFGTIAGLANNASTAAWTIQNMGSASVTVNVASGVNVASASALLMVGTRHSIIK